MIWQYIRCTIYAVCIVYPFYEMYYAGITLSALCLIGCGAFGIADAAPKLSQYYEEI